MHINEANLSQPKNLRREFQVGSVHSTLDEAIAKLALLAESLFGDLNGDTPPSGLLLETDYAYAVIHAFNQARLFEDFLDPDQMKNAAFLWALRGLSTQKLTFYSGFKIGLNEDLSKDIELWKLAKCPNNYEYAATFSQGISALDFRFQQSKTYKVVESLKSIWSKSYFQNLQKRVLEKGYDKEAQPYFDCLHTILTALSPSSQSPYAPPEREQYLDLLKDQLDSRQIKLVKYFIASDEGKTFRESGLLDFHTLFTGE